MKCTNHFIKYLGFILLLFLLPITLQAQNITVKGTVKDAFGPVIGASVDKKEQQTALLLTLMEILLYHFHQTVLLSYLLSVIKHKKYLYPEKNKLRLS